MNSSFKERQEKWKHFAEFEIELAYQESLSLPQRLKIANALFVHAQALGKLKRKDPLEGLEEKIAYLKKLKRV